jgi:hypothetical protein
VVIIVTATVCRSFHKNLNKCVLYDKKIKQNVPVRILPGSIYLFSFFFFLFYYYHYYHYFYFEVVFGLFVFIFFYFLISLLSNLICKKNSIFCCISTFRNLFSPSALCTCFTCNILLFRATLRLKLLTILNAVSTYFLTIPVAYYVNYAKNCGK